MDKSSLENSTVSGGTGTIELPRFALVVPVSGSGRIDRSLVYSIPGEFRPAIKIGSIVAVGVRKSVRIGIVTGFMKPEKIDPPIREKIRPIRDVYADDELIGEWEVEVARWMSRYYACSLRDAFSPFIPEIKALRAISYLVVPDRNKFFSKINELGLLFSTSSEMKLEERSDGFFGTSNKALMDVLVSGGITEESASEKIDGWIDCGILQTDIVIRSKITHAGKGGYLTLSEIGRGINPSEIRSTKQRQVIELFLSVSPVLARDIVLREIPGSQSAIKTMLKKSLMEEIVDESLIPSGVHSPSDMELTVAQKAAVEKICDSTDKAEDQTFLLFGVTGSGKTEVYIEVCRHVLSLGKTATVLVPEIALTHQAVKRFMAVFPGRIALFHSELTDRERLHEWRAVRKGERDIVIGARSALFVPVKNRGVIIIDEESETAYKQHQRPRYNAREVARKMANMENSVVVLGSATPSVESFYRAKNNSYEMIALPDRVVGGQLPEVRITRPTPRKSKDARTIKVKGKEFALGLISDKLKEELENTLNSNRQAILLLNQRGFSRTLICQECGWVPVCENCDVPLTYHRIGNIQLCHYCGHRERSSVRCGKCASDKLDYLGYGTERLEAEVRFIFPDARIHRMDRDTVRTRGRRKKIIDDMRAGNVDILVGTQMIAKGLDFPNVRLVGVVSADSSLFIPDFRASERTFQLLTQVVGRAGRSDALELEGGGIAIIQSYSPDNRVLQTASRQDYIEFYNSEIILRQKFGYPPSVKLARILFAGKNAGHVGSTSDLYSQMLKRSGAGDKIIVAGPAPAPLERLEGKYRYHIILKSVTTSDLAAVLGYMLKKFKPPADVKVEIDVDPVSMM